MQSAGIQARYDDALRRLGATTQVPAREILARYPPLPHDSTADATSSSSSDDAATRDDAALAALHKCKFYRDFAASPADVNAEREMARQKVSKQRGMAALVTRALRSKRHHVWKKERQFDFRLTPHETQRLARHGVAVSQRLRAESFAEVYYRLYTDDLPVYVTTDSILHAWHRSFDAALVDIETLECRPTLARVLAAARAQCRRQLLALGDGTSAITGSKESNGSSATNGEDARASDQSRGSRYTTRLLLDVDLFLCVALRLLATDETETTEATETAEEPNSRVPGDDATPLPANAARFAELQRAIAAQEMAHLVLFGTDVRAVDCSRFQPRGHYTASPALAAYFRAMTWLGTIDLRVSGTDDAASDLYQLQCAVALVALLRQSRCMETLASLDALITSLVGDSGVGADSLTPMQLDALLPRAMTDTALLAQFAAASAPPALLELQQAIRTRGLGAQRISGHPRVEDSGGHATQPSALPLSFAVVGERFVWSAFVCSRVVFDQVAHGHEKVVRRIPSGVDVAFALLANNAAGAVAASRMLARPPRTDADADGDTDTALTVPAAPAATDSFVRLRDGVPYASNLLALRESIDASFAQTAVASSGVAATSTSTRTNTSTSVAESDQDDPSGCSADGSESVSTLWLRALRALSTPSVNAARVFHSRAWELRQLNTQLASFTQLRHDSLLYAKQSYTSGTRCEYAAGFVDPYPQFYASMQALASRMAHLVERLESPADDSRLRDHGAYFFRAFAETMATLAAIATRQARKQRLSDEQTDFVKTVMEERFGSGATKYAGWYPRLFYARREDAGVRDVLVADVHTDVASIEHDDPHGGVLHLGVGDVFTGFFVVDGVVYCGPVFSSYEFVSSSATERLDDAAFQSRVDAMVTTSSRRITSTSSETRERKRQRATAALSAPDWALASFLC